MLLLVEDHTLSSQSHESSANAAKGLASGVHAAIEIYSVHAQNGAYSLTRQPVLANHKLQTWENVHTNHVAPAPLTMCPAGRESVIIFPR